MREERGLACFSLCCLSLPIFNTSPLPPASRWPPSSPRAALPPRPPAALRQAPGRHRPRRAGAHACVLRTGVGAEGAARQRSAPDTPALKLMTLTSAPLWPLHHHRRRRQATPLFPELLRRAAALVTECPCAYPRGCPACVQHLDCKNYVRDKGGGADAVDSGGWGSACACSLFAEISPPFAPLQQQPPTADRTRCSPSAARSSCSASRSRRRSDTRRPPPRGSGSARTRRRRLELRDRNVLLIAQYAQ